MADYMAKLKLKVQKRNIFGRKVRKLRQEGILPANVYGKKIKSQAVKLSLADFSSAYKKAGETNLVDLLIEGKKEVVPVLIDNVQIDPISDRPVHADFHQVSLTEKIKTEIPIEFVGESPAVAQKKGILVHLLTEIVFFALMRGLPRRIEVDVSLLKEVGDTIKISDIKVGEKVSVSVSADRLVVKIEPPTKIEEDKAPVEETEEGASTEEQPEEGEKADDQADKPKTEGAKKEGTKKEK